MQPLDVSTDDAFRSFLPGQHEDDRSLIVEFFLGKKLMGAKSLEAEREIYEDREFVRVQIKGQDKQVVVREVEQQDRDKYPIAYQAFQLRKPVPVVGTPVEQLPGVGPSQAHHLKGINLRTIEDVANVTDENTLQRIGMGARDLVRRAQAFLAKSTDRTVALEKENEELRRIVAEMDERMKALEAKPKRGAKKETAQ